MIKVTVNLRASERDALRVLSARERRTQSDQAAILIRDSLLSNVPQWGNKLPTKPGYYWVVDSDQPKNIRLVYVRDRNGNAKFLDSGRLVSLLKLDKWLGPLPEPEPPQE